MASKSKREKGACKKMFLKPRKKSEMIALYIAGAIGQLLTIIMWFPTTLKGTYFNESLLIGKAPTLEIKLFSYGGGLPIFTLILNVAILLLSVVSLVLLVIPLIRKTVMKPRLMILPVVLNLIYLILFLLRYRNAVNSYQLFDIPITPVFVLYLIGLAFAFSTALTILIYYPILKKQAAPAETE